MYIVAKSKEVVNKPCFGNRKKICRQVTIYLFYGMIRDIVFRGMAMDEFQRGAVSHKTGAALVVAGPGSGKTRVIAERLRYLVSDQKVSARSIVALSFTRAASKELRDRSLQMDGSLSEVFFGTFHSFFLRLLRESGFYDYDSVMDESEKNAVIRDIVRAELGISSVPPEIVDMLRHEIANADSGRSDPASKAFVRRAAQRYREYKNLRKKIDFEDIIRETKKILEEEAGFCASLRQRYRYFFVDEYQDIDPLQFESIRLLLGPEKNLFAVGDEDQSIYGFRGADPAFLTEFERYFEKAAIYRLTRSYRCPQRIMTAANRLIAHNKKRRPKKMFSQTGEEGTVRLICCKDRREQAECIRRRILQIGRPEDCMVIYRSHIEALPLMQSLSEANIPFAAKDFRFGLFRHFIYRDLQAFLRLMLRFQDQKADMRREEDIRDINRVLNKPHRHLLPLSFARPESLRGRFEEAVKRKKIEKTLVRDLMKLDRNSFTAAAEGILFGIGYRRYLEGCSLLFNLSMEVFEEVLEQIFSLVSEGADAAAALSELEECRRLEEKKRVKTGEEQSVLLVTAHGAKGLEREYVFVLSLNQGVFPHIRNMSGNRDENLEEERRLLYVAMTRSKSELELFTLSDPRGGEKSVFLSEIGIREAELAEKSFSGRR